MDFQLIAERVETTLSLRLERAQLAAERLEHRLHMLQTNIQVRSEQYLISITNLLETFVDRRFLSGDYQRRQREVRTKSAQN